MAKKSKSFKMSPEQQKLAAVNINLAREWAWKYERRTGIEYSILESAAFEGLCQAAAKYDPELINQQTGSPMRFSSLAVPYIRGSILHYIRDRTYFMRLTHKMRETWVKGRKMMNLGMGDVKISESLGISLKEWQDTKCACSGPPLELKDQSTPTEALEPDEIDRLTAFRQEACKMLDSMPEKTRKRFMRFCEGRGTEPGRLLKEELDRLTAD